MSDSNPSSEPNSNAAALHTTPYDALWTWSAAATIGLAVLSFVYLTSGTVSPFSGDERDLQDDAAVFIAYFAVLLNAAGLTALGAIAFVAKSATPKALIPWPRFAILESETRSQFVASVSLVAATLIPTIVLYSSAYKYLGKSRISEWHSSSPLAGGFWESRQAALQLGCFNNPCFRMHPGEQAPEWFVASDVALSLLVATSIAAVIFLAGLLLRQHWPQRD